jgi:hypothetical protein
MQSQRRFWRPPACSISVTVSWRWKRCAVWSGNAYVYIYIYLLAVCKNVCIYVCMYLFIYSFIYLYIHISTCIYILSYLIYLQLYPVDQFWPSLRDSQQLHRFIASHVTGRR